jgi:cystathionine gamma-lyase
VSDQSAFQPSTLVIHSNRVYENQSNSILFPIHQTATYIHESVGVTKGYGYSRGANPTVNALEQAIAAVEGTNTALCFRSGMAAISTLCLALLKAGDHVVLSDVIYGGTARLFEQVLGNFAIAYSYVDTSNVAAVEQALRPSTRLIFAETPANPTLKLSDVKGLAELAHSRENLLLAVDNTFLTPLLQNCLALGADISMLSTTKYIDGHNATIGGSLATHNEALIERLRLVRKTLGTIQAPFDAWLALQGIKTLPARLAMHCSHAAQLAAWLEEHPRVARVYYPGLDSFPQKALDVGVRARCDDGRVSAFHGGSQAVHVCGEFRERRDADYKSRHGVSLRFATGVAESVGHYGQADPSLRRAGRSQGSHRRFRTGF